MRKRDFDIVFSSLGLGSHTFTFSLSDTFLALFGYEDHQKLEATATVTLLKQNTFLEVNFALAGTIEVFCDRTGEPFLQNIGNSFDLLVKFGEAYNDIDDETLILPQGEYQLNVAQYLYELVVLGIPIKNVHPDAKKSKKAKPEAELPKQTEQSEEDLDPRWDKLKDLLN